MTNLILLRKEDNSLQKSSIIPSSTQEQSTGIMWIAWNTLAMPFSQRWVVISKLVTRKYFNSFLFSPAKMKSFAGSPRLNHRTKTMKPFVRMKSLISIRLVLKTASCGSWGLEWTTIKGYWLWVVRPAPFTFGIWMWRIRWTFSGQYYFTRSANPQYAKQHFPEMEIFWYWCVMTPLFGVGIRSKWAMDTKWSMRLIDVHF